MQANSMFLQRLLGLCSCHAACCCSVSHLCLCGFCLLPDPRFVVLSLQCALIDAAFNLSSFSLLFNSYVWFHGLTLFCRLFFSSSGTVLLGSDCFSERPGFNSHCCLPPPASRVGVFTFCVFYVLILANENVGVSLCTCAVDLLQSSPFAGATSRPFRRVSPSGAERAPLPPLLSPPSSSPPSLSSTCTQG